MGREVKIVLKMIPKLKEEDFDIRGSHSYEPDLIITKEGTTHKSTQKSLNAKARWRVSLNG